MFDDQGSLRQELFSPEAQQVLEGIRAWLAEVDRRMFLPLDLLIVLLERGHEELAGLVADGTDGVVDDSDVLPRLQLLSREIDEDPSDKSPVLERTSFSRGFTRILMEAWHQAQARNGDLVRELDLVRSVTWRAEAVESASVRWAIRRLSEGKGDQLFDEKGLLREAMFHESTWRILQGAMKLAAAHGTPFLGTPHLIAMLCSVKNSTIWRSAKARGLEPGRLREELLRLIGSKPSSIPEFLVGRKTLTPRMIRMLSFSAKQANNGPITETHLIEGFLDDGGSSLELIQALGLESEIRNALGEPKVLEHSLPVEAAIEFAAKRQPTPTLDMLGRDLTEEALEGKLPEIVGREKELQRVVNVLLRREQRNPLLTGEAGVGKTALAVGLAQRIASGQVPRKLQGYRVVELNGASLMSGTSYRGDLESRIKSLLEEASKDVILFIDEAHAVFAPRSGSNTPAEVPNHFKRALASGDIAVVGATTEAEYHRWIEQDPALKRRFERIEIKEPAHEVVAKILEALIPDLEADYDVDVDETAIESAIELSVRYLPEQRLPDKSKKLLMDACIARANDLVGAEDGEEDAESSQLVTRDDVARQVFLKTGIPLDRLLRGEINWWVGIEERLGESVVGQDLAITQVAHALVSSRLRNANRNRPMAVLLFVGPPGVGKSTLARALAEEIFNDSAAVLRLDMTDFQEPHSMSRLIGSPPGYVGYDDEDLFVTPLRRRPSSVVLLEDFDCAHERIQERMLRLVEEGDIVDTRGHRADVRNALFILTVNAETGRGGKKIGFADNDAGTKTLDNEKAFDALDKALAGRLRDYIDAAVTFRELGGAGESPAIELLERRIDSFMDAMRSEYRLDIALDASLRDRLIERAAEMSDARSIEQLVSDFLYSPVTEALLKGKGGSCPRLRWNAEHNTVEIVSRDEAPQA
ncbi:AAA family ATPase [Persicimonas caeni]|uniref:AAA family ATPase n=1 Tax=Persicimonas caeni TaxID=2292766 RepID=UPI00164DB1B8|nr:ATP-dependent Clp protease ATP-binding subunit [Persicimonas caeni]